MAIKVIISKCPQNHPCPAVKVCPVGALVQEGHMAPTVTTDKCISCGKCSDFCPKRALVLED
ncbi:MAG: 4Fe-4S binding protein [Oscillospiraceae bacterium]